MKETTETLVVKFQQGEIPFEVVYKKCKRMVFREASKWKIKGMDRDDIISELMLALFEACERFDIEKGYKFSTFAINHLRYRIREEWRKTTLPKYGSEWTICSADGTLGVKSRRIYEAGLMKVSDDPFESFLHTELERFVFEELELLKEPGKSYVIDYLFSGMSKKEIADMYNKSPQNIHWHLKNSMKKIQQSLIVKGLK